MNIIEKTRPLHDFVVLRRDSSETTSKGGILIPETAQDKVTRGVVIAVGPGKLNERGQRVEPQVKKGDHVIFGKYSGNQVDDKAGHLGSGDFLVMREEEIVGVVEE